MINYYFSPPSTINIWPLSTTSLYATWTRILAMAIVVVSNLIPTKDKKTVVLAKLHPNRLLPSSIGRKEKIAQLYGSPLRCPRLNPNSLVGPQKSKWATMSGRFAPHQLLKVKWLHGYPKKSSKNRPPKNPSSKTATTTFKLRICFLLE